MVSKTIFYILFTAWPWLALLACFGQVMRRYDIALKTTRSAFIRGKKKSADPGKIHAKKPKRKSRNKSGFII